MQTAQLVADTGAQVVLTGNIGPTAVAALSEAGVEVIMGVRGTVENAVTRYLQGQLQPTGQPKIQLLCGFGPGGRGPMAPMGTKTTFRPPSSQSENSR
jgi:predicted Fe-Mo cluster-binding NifX family protein